MRVWTRPSAHPRVPVAVRSTELDPQGVVIRRRLAALSVYARGGECQTGAEASSLQVVTDAQPQLGVELAEVTKGMISLHRRFYGKGPTKAKTYVVNDTVVCVLEGGFTTVERTLIDEKDVEAVLQVRRSFQRAMEDHFTEVVESALGRKVIAYMSQIHADPDMAVELFVLEPRGEVEGDVMGEYDEVVTAEEDD
jgi:uncharacterized protein YbcI